MDITTNEQKHGKQEQNYKLDNKGVGGRRQLKPYVVNISFKYETSGRGKEECLGQEREETSDFDKDLEVEKKERKDQ